MAWAALTAAEIKTRLSGPELTALQGAALATGQSDPLPEVIAQVTNLIRGYIAVRYPLGTAGTLPPELKDAAIAIARWRLIGRLAIGGAGGIMPSEQRKQEYDEAIKLVQSIAEGKFAIELPDPIDETPHASTNAQYGGEPKLDFINS
jgi:phage gp36-like protein